VRLHAGSGRGRDRAGAGYPHRAALPAGPKVPRGADERAERSSGQPRA
jgi:hypothetical protein